jgi:glycosyltransferase involved in cell wall biosynthesis
MDNRVNVVFLWAEVTGYLHGVLNNLTKEVDSIKVVYWDKKGVNNSQYQYSSNSGINFYPRSTYDNDKIYDLLIMSRPSIIVVSGWMDQGYVNSCKKYSKINKDVSIVLGLDEQWRGTFRQHVGKIYYSIFYKHIFKYIWVSGFPQYTFAQHLGYETSKILLNLYSADVNTFNTIAKLNKRFIYVGRFIKIKSPDILLNAYLKLPLDIQEQWPLVFIGDGDMKFKIESSNNPNINIIPFLQPNDLREELLKGGVACMPSFKDNWGVSVQEFALLGLPMILSSGVGAGTFYLIPGFNGFLFKKGDVDSLYNQLLKIANCSDEKLNYFSENSKKLSLRITNEISAKSLMSVLDLKDSA